MSYYLITCSQIIRFFIFFLNGTFTERERDKVRNKVGRKRKGKLLTDLHCFSTKPLQNLHTNLQFDQLMLLNVDYWHHSFNILQNVELVPFPTRWLVELCSPLPTPYSFTRYALAKTSLLQEKHVNAEAKNFSILHLSSSFTLFWWYL